MRYRAIETIVDATQWCKNGDLPDDVVRRCLTQEHHGTDVCTVCSAIMEDHGWMDGAIEGVIVCPGDWVITTEAGTRFACSPDHFHLVYEPVAPETPLGTPIRAVRTIRMPMNADLIEDMIDFAILELRSGVHNGIVSGMKNAKNETLTRREQFAMAAMQGIIASKPSASNYTIANDAVAYADALIKSLNR
jgi:hypothetical protein